MREHMVADSRNHPGKFDAELTIDIPPVCSELWHTFLQLCTSRRAGMSAQAFTLVDVQSWCHLFGVTFTNWELDTLLAMDAAALKVLAKIRAAAAPTES